jgi:hypothetical protein
MVMTNSCDVLYWISKKYIVEIDVCIMVDANETIGANGEGSGEWKQALSMNLVFHIICLIQIIIISNCFPLCRTTNLNCFYLLFVPL